MPGVTDGIESLCAVVNAAAEAGASQVWHSTLNLGTVTRDAYFSYLRDRRPELVARHERLFSRGRYAQPEYVREVQRRMQVARAGVRFARTSVLADDPSGEQLRIF